MFKPELNWLVPAFLAGFLAILDPASAQPQATVEQSCGDIDATLRRPASSVPIDAATVRQFYKAFGDGCAWTEASALGLIEVLRASGDHGLEPSLFHAEALYWPQNPVTPNKAAERDVLLSDAAIKYAIILSRGLSRDPALALDQAADYRPNGELIDGLIDAIYQGSTGEWLRSLAPSYDAYIRLQAALINYRAVAQAGGWGQIPLSLAKSKRRSKSFAQLRTRLALEGDLAVDSGSAKFDEALYQALARFQLRNGMRSDGELTAKTIERLNISVGERIALMALNLERLRVSLRDMPLTRVEVNAPAATAVLFRDGTPHLSMNAVVGAPKHETPELSSTIDSIVVNPTWTIPASIIKNEIKPLLRRNPNYLTQNRMYWSGDQLVQESGPQNALGRIKFDFPNRYSVYLHDTPSRKLFTDPERAASHGCVRLERPLELAVELLTGSADWNREEIEQAIRAGETRRIGLENPMPVVITYQTAFVDHSGLVHFRADIYGRDTELTLRLAERAGALKAEPAQW